jgi:hypothetical protein
VRELEEDARDDHRSAPTALKVFWYDFLGRFSNGKKC